MKRTLPSYDQALALCQGKDAPFYEAKFAVEGYAVSIFNYRLAMYSDFIDNDAFEMRGLTFVFNEDGSLYKRYLLLHKFFNLNQVAESQYSLVKGLGVRSVYNKEDGSVASFIRLPNGSVLGKSKMSFDSDQAAGMNRIYRNNADLKRLVDWSLDNDYVAVFEYVAPHNRIVLKYRDEELILLRLRDNKTGEYLDLSAFSDVIGSVRVAPSYSLSLDELVQSAKSAEGIEGWIVQFDSGLFLKVKTAWYCERHGLLTCDLYREHVLVGYVLDEKIDDILGQIPEDEAEAHARIEKIIAAVKLAVSEKAASILASYDLFLKGGEGKDWSGDLRIQLMRKAFAQSYRKDPNFGYVMSLSKGNADAYDLAKGWVAGECRKLKVAREFLKLRDESLFFLDAPEDEDGD